MTSQTLTRLLSFATCDLVVKALQSDNRAPFNNERVASKTKLRNSPHIILSSPDVVLALYELLDLNAAGEGDVDVRFDETTEQMLTE